MAPKKNRDGLYHKGKDKHGVDMWLMVVSCGTDVNGKRRKPSRIFHGSRPEAKLARAAFVLEMQKAVARDENPITLREWAEQCLMSMAGQLAASTLADYRRKLGNRILPALGKVPLVDLQRWHIAEFYRQLDTSKNLRWRPDPDKPDEEPPLISGHTRHKHHTVLHIILEHAVKAGLIPSNPADAVEAPQMSRHEAEYYDEMDVRRLLEALEEQPLRFKAIITLAISTGLRRGELIALRWQDIDCYRRELTVNNACTNAAGPQRLKSAKNDSSQRTIPIPEPAVNLLCQWHRAQRQAEGEQEFICTRAGQWMKLDYISHWFPKFLTKHHLPTLSLHGLRHTYASILVANVPVVAASRLLGHSNVTTTNNIYSHVLNADKEKALTAITAALSTKTVHQSGQQPEN